MTFRLLALLLGAGPAAVGLVWQSAPRGTDEKAWVVNDGVNLRSGPSRDAPVVSRLSLGEEVTILGVAGPIEVIDGVSERWYQVRTYSGDGCLFGGTLTGARWEADLDEDGELERATVTLGANGTAIVRVAELAVPPPGGVAELKVDIGTDIAGLTAVKGGPQITLSNGKREWVCSYGAKAPGYRGQVRCE